MRGLILVYRIIVYSQHLSKYVVTGAFVHMTEYSICVSVQPKDKFILYRVYFWIEVAHCLLSVHVEDKMAGGVQG